MRLSKNWRLILYFTVTGLLVAAAAGLCVVLHAPNPVTNLMLLASPGLWLLWLRLGMLLADVQLPAIVMQSFTVAIVGIANGLLYGMVGAVIVGVRSIFQSRDSQS